MSIIGEGHQGGAPVTFKLWIDDQLNDPAAPARHTPEGFIGAASAAEAVSIVERQGLPNFIDFDHDLGDGQDSVQFIRECIDRVLDDCRSGRPVKVPDFAVHSANPVGAERIVSWMRSWQQLAHDPDLGPRLRRERLEEIAQLPDGTWDDPDEYTPAPNTEAVERTRQTLAWVEDVHRVTPFEYIDVEPDVMGGVAIYLRRGPKYAWFSFMNDGEDTILLFEDREPTADRLRPYNPKDLDRVLEFLNTCP